MLNASMRIQTEKAPFLAMAWKHDAQFLVGLDGNVLPNPLREPPRHHPYGLISEIGARCHLFHCPHRALGQAGSEKTKTSASCPCREIRRPILVVGSQF